MLDAAGKLLATTHLGGLGFPQGLAVDPTGRVYVSYALSPRYGQIAVLDGVTGALVRLIPPTLDHPLAGAGRLTIARASGDPPARHLRIDSTRRGIDIQSESEGWIDARSIVFSIIQGHDADQSGFQRRTQRPCVCFMKSWQVFACAGSVLTGRAQPV